MASALRHVVRARLAPFVLCSTLVGPCAHAQVDNALYMTGEGATARLRGDTTALPAGAARCANCHEPSRQPGADEAALGPRLDHRLAQRLPRRGGPPSAYDPASLCTLLRTGLDPAHILVRRVMPVYEIDESACSALWQVFSRRDAPAEVRP